MEQIQLREFIKDTLVEIALGVRKANEELTDPDKNQFEPFLLRCNIGDYSKNPGIKFDVALTAAKGKTEKAGFFVALATIGGGANIQDQKNAEMSHRIQFEVGIDDTWK